MFANVKGTVKVKCPVKCSFIKSNINGIDKYTDTSSVCQAAIHAGAANDHGGSFGLLFTTSEAVNYILNKFINL
jgi:hypothetical protein